MDRSSLALSINGVGVRPVGDFCHRYNCVPDQGELPVSLGAFLSDDGIAMDGSMALLHSDKGCHLFQPRRDAVRRICAPYEEWNTRPRSSVREKIRVCTAAGALLFACPGLAAGWLAPAADQTVTASWVTEITTQLDQ